MCEVIDKTNGYNHTVAVWYKCHLYYFIPDNFAGNVRFMRFPEKII